MAMRIAKELPSADESASAGLCSEVLKFWDGGLLPHIRTECECLLARLARHVPLDDGLIRSTQADHLHINSLAMAMRDDVEAAIRRETLNLLGEALREHIRWEEEVLFEAAQRLLKAEEMMSLGADVAERIPEVPESTWPKRPG